MTFIRILYCSWDLLIVGIWVLSSKNNSFSFYFCEMTAKKIFMMVVVKPETATWLMKQPHLLLKTLYTFLHKLFV